ncbi:recombinase family protein [Kordiimonas aquimaris]|uniref:recombinase family protein n=1 Tax=Kordiimonas aquimaris TaxID=707591 RepID=UPI0021D3906D|nr:recombinase family protein [Kordiimonas aquimaris]
MPIDTKQKVFAAEYVRMSTEHQKYSTQNQAAKIREYADRHNLEIIQSYEDKGKNGLSLDGRPALKQLISDAKSGAAVFKYVLVYDVSRWGRFQDADESAYYEYLCKQAGLKIVYCAEQFENDGSPVSTIVKGVKRAMAGEYSRELSAKVFAGQCRLIEMGFRQGGPAGYGLRRILIDQNGSKKGILKSGEQKSLQTDRVILVPGPSEEVDWVNAIYRWYVDQDCSLGEIVSRLTTQGVRAEEGRKWTLPIVRQILSNEKYIGNNVFNRRSFKLKRLHVVNSPDMWIRKDGAFEAIVSKDLFCRAQSKLKQRGKHFSKEEMLVGLAQLLKRKGRLTAQLINADPDVPSAITFANRFGGLFGAYEKVGYTGRLGHERWRVRKRLLDVALSLIERIEQTLIECGGRVEKHSVPFLLSLNDELRISLILMESAYSPYGLTWTPLTKISTADITILTRMDSMNLEIMDFIALPFEINRQISTTITPANERSYACWRYADLGFLRPLAGRKTLPLGDLKAGVQ